MNLIHILFWRSKRASTACSYLFVILLAFLYQVHSWTTHLADNPALRLHPVRLRYKETESPFCYAVTVDPTSSTETQISIPYNFLATQVWPASRVAATVLNYVYPRIIVDVQQPGMVIATTTFCEFGCGPGLPSLTLAKKWKDWKDPSPPPPPIRVIATDIDPLALQLVSLAAMDQGLDPMVSTQIFDLTREDYDSIPLADFYILCDVFESSLVAQGAARVIHHILTSTHYQSSRVWVFCQSDRVQKDAFLQEWIHCCRKQEESIQDLEDCKWDKLTSATLCPEMSLPRQRLWLCEFDELMVPYG
jgi:hypothetical protein